MSRRKVVNPNLEILLPLIKKVCRSNVVFCEKMGRSTQKTWVTGWSNKPKPKNLPSPEEAAKMCLLLKTTPEEILLHSGPTEEETQKCLEDIEEVKRLIEVERGKNVKKEAPAEVGGGKDALLDFIRKTDDRTTLLAVLDEVNKKLQEMQ